jgi:CSLREA domain-containing protein
MRAGDRRAKGSVRVNLWGRSVVGFGAALVLMPGAASASTITVNSTGDAAANDSTCTLREAIGAANTNTASADATNGCPAGQAAPTVDQIQFSIAGAGPHVIGVSTLLDAITEPVAIDATSEPNEVRVDDAASVGTGLDVEADDVVIRDLTITGFNFTMVDLAGTDGALVDGNVIGTDQAGTAGLGGAGGIRAGVAGIGGDVTNAIITGNKIASETSWGIQVGNDATSGIVIQDNRIGTTPAGTAALGNGFGISVVDGVDDVTIGGPDAADRNLVSGNVSSGIQVSNGSGIGEATNVVVQGNRVGTGVAGEAAVPNARGIVIHGNVIGAEVRDNLVSGNAEEGVTLAGTASAVGADPTQTVIAGNLIGTDDDGVEELGNGDNGILFTGTSEDALTDNVIGGTAGLTPGSGCAGDCNVIAANADVLSEPAVGIAASDISGTQIMGNHIGVDVTGLNPLGNFGVGVSLSGAGDGIVVGSAAARNVIADNGSDAVHLDGTDGARIQGNLIGVGSDGITPLANAGHGIVIRSGATGTLVGGTTSDAANVIAFNSTGVRIEDTATGNAILGNSLHNNSSLGIDLFGGLGVDVNDALDIDGGANEGQNYPVLTAAVAGDPGVVAGALASEPSTEYRVEVFSNTAADPTAHGEGELLLGAFTVTTDSAGDAPFSQSIDAAVDPGEPITATATKLDDQGNPLATSEFAANTAAVACDVTGTSGDDSLTGLGASEDVICGLGGDDEVTPDGGNDIVVGGDGTDEVDFSSSADPLDADLVLGLASLGTDSVALAGIEDVTGSDFDDTITGDFLANALFGGEGKDELDGGDGKDTLKGQDSKDTLKGQGDKDELKGGDSGDELKGGDGDKDDIDGNDGGDSLNGGGGDKDDCNGGSGNDKHDGGCEKKHSL